MMEIVEVDCRTGDTIRRALTGEEQAAREAEIAEAEAQNARLEQLDANAATLRDRAAQALTANAAYLAKVAAGSAIQQDHVVQVGRLTRECSALIRLVLRLVDNVDGT